MILIIWKCNLWSSAIKAYYSPIFKATYPTKALAALRKCHVYCLFCTRFVQNGEESLFCFPFTGKKTLRHLQKVYRGYWTTEKPSSLGGVSPSNKLLTVGLSTMNGCIAFPKQSQTSGTLAMPIYRGLTHKIQNSYSRVASAIGKQYSQRRTLFR